MKRFAAEWPKGARVLDVACGSGRHSRWLAENGLAVTSVDRDAQALQGLRGMASTVHADLEAAAWPLPGEVFDVVVVTNYLWRPLFPSLISALGDGGWLIYETFAQGQAAFGRPTRAEFLLEEGELLRLCARLHIVAFEDGLLQQPLRRVQRIAARRLTGGGIETGASPSPATLDR